MIGAVEPANAYQLDGDTYSAIRRPSAHGISHVLLLILIAADVRVTA
jgi:hypothetical protein